MAACASSFKTQPCTVTWADVPRFLPSGRTTNPGCLPRYIQRHIYAARSSRFSSARRRISAIDHPPVLRGGIFDSSLNNPHARSYQLPLQYCGLVFVLFHTRRLLCSTLQVLIFFTDPPAVHAITHYGRLNGAQVLHLAIRTSDGYWWSAVPTYRSCWG